MKKYKYLFLIFIFIFSLCSCGGNESKENNPPDPKGEELPKDDELEDEVLRNGDLHSDSIILSEADYKQYENNLFSNDTTNLLNEKLENVENIKKNNTNYFVILFYGKWDGTDYLNAYYNHLFYFNTYFDVSLFNGNELQNDISKIEFEEHICKTYDVSGNVNRMNFDATIDMNKNAFNRIVLYSYTDNNNTNYNETYQDCVKASVVIPFKTKDDGKYNFDFSLSQDECAYEESNSMVFQAGSTGTIDETVKINNFKVSYISENDALSGIDDNKLNDKPKFALNYNQYMVIDVELEALKDNLEKISLSINSSSYALDMTVEESPTSQMTEKANSILLELGLPNQLNQTKKYRTIIKMKPIDNIYTCVKVLLFGNCIRLNNYSNSFCFLKDLNGLVYDSTGTIINCTKKNIEEISIPSEHNGYVVGIGKEVFKDMKKLRIVNLEDGVSSIGDNAFLNCSALTNIKIPESCTNIASNAFDGCKEELFKEYENCLYLGNEYNNYLALVKPKNNSSTYSFNVNTKILAGGAFENNNVITNINTFGIMYIGSGAFKNCSNLVTITFGQAAKVIYNDAFNNCVKITNIDFKNVEEIGDNAFANCYLITELNVPNSVKEIGLGAFSGCYNIAKVNLPFVGKNESNERSFQYPLGYIFGTKEYENSIETIQEYYGQKTNYYGATSSGTKISLVEEAFYLPSALKEVVIDNCSYIPQGAFSNCNKIEIITIGDSITKIVSPFTGCSSLKKLTIGKGVRELGILIDSETKLEELTIPYIGATRNDQLDSYGKPKNSEPFGHVFTYNYYPNSTMIRQYNYLKSTYDYAYFPNTLKKVIITNEKYVAVSAFAYCSTIEYIVLNEGIEVIENSAFSNCNSLVNITLPSTFSTINKSTFLGCTSLKEIIIPEGVEEIGEYSFDSCSSLENVVIGDTVTKIGQHAFSGCTGLKSITIGKNVNAIEDYAFSGCASLKKVNIVDLANYCAIKMDTYNVSEQASPFYYGADLYINNQLVKELIIPEGVTEINDAHFYNSNITSLILPSTVYNVSNKAFYNCKIEYLTTPCISIPSDYLKELTITYRVTYSYDDVQMCSFASTEYRDSTTLESLIIEDGVDSISNYAFENCTSLKRVIAPKSLDYIGTNAFTNCPIEYAKGHAKLLDAVANPSLTEAVLVGDQPCTMNKRNNLVKFSIEDSTKYESKDNSNTIVEIETKTLIKGFGNFTIPNGVEIIATYAFQNASIANLVIPASVTRIRAYAFLDCSLLESVTIQEGITTIEEGTFKNCSNLETITIPDSVKTIEKDAFYDCASLKNINLDSNITSLGSQAFYNCSSLSTLDIKANITTILENTFYGCENLRNITIPNTVTTIGVSAFAGCIALEEINIPNSITKIGEYAFDGCTGLKKININNLANWITMSMGNLTANPLYYAHNLYLNGNLITDLVIPNTVNGIGDYRFAGMNVKSINISSSVKYLTSKAFYKTTGLESIVVDENNTVYDSRDNCNAILEKENSSHLNQTYLLLGCKNTIIPESVSIIWDYAFYYCTDLKEIVITNDVKSIGKSAFEGCSSLTTVTIGTNVKYIDKYAFNNCSSLATVNYLGDETKWNTISIELGNTALINATKNYNYIP